MTTRSGQAGGNAAQGPRSTAALLTLAVCAALAFLTLAALGTWQLQRLQWKRDLIARVQERIHAAPVPAPGPERWETVTAESDEYRRVRAGGTFRHESATLVQGATALGAGYWVMTPLRQPDGSTVLVNRGFIPPAEAARVRAAPQQAAAEAKAAEGAGPAGVIGLLRLSQPGGGFLRENDPAAGRWYSRDVQAIAEARGLGPVAPYFIDAQADPGRPAGSAVPPSFAQPAAGLTVVAFSNNHLGYALTWYALALMTAGAAFWVWRDQRKHAGKHAGDDDETD